LPDSKTTASCCQLGDELIRETITKYGLDAYLGALRYSCDESAETMSRALVALPDGDYEGTDIIDADGLDDSEEYTIRVSLKKRGSLVEADFSGSSRQARTSINAGPLDAKTAVGVALKMLLEPAGNLNSG